MNHPKELVVDANILFRGVFGTRVGELLKTYGGAAIFYSPEICFADARRRLPGVAARRKFDLEAASMRLDRLELVVRVAYRSEYEALQAPASARIGSRDSSDWPIVATSLLLNAPLWTEDRDFFGCGIATWTTNNVGIYLRGE